MTATLIVSDLHVNSTVSLAAPTIPHDDGCSGKPSKLQKVIYKNWELLINRAREISQEENLVVVFGGDIGDIRTKYGGYQIHTLNQAKVKEHICELIEPLCTLAQAVYFVRGTPEHVGASAWLEELVADDFDNTVKNPETDSNSWFILPLEVDRVKIEIAHHAGMGQLPWTRKNVANQLASRTIIEYSNVYQDIPDLVIRGHMHRWADSGDNYRVRAIYLPCWTAASEYVHIVNAGSFSEIGAIVVHTNNGKYTVEKLKYEIEKRKWHKQK